MFDLALPSLARHLRLDPALLRQRLQPVRGGLESKVARASLPGALPAGCPWPERFMIKELRGAQRREAAIYDQLWRRLPRPPMVALLGRDEYAGVDYIYLEEAAADGGWPWRDAAAAASVCRALADFHRGALDLGSLAADWDYETELAGSALETLELARHTPGRGNRPWRRLGELHRVVAALADLRGELAADGFALIHGDVHPGNVIVRPGPEGWEPVLIDWGRARRGSPWEDVASWLQSLGCWEPEAARRHDSLLRAYRLHRHGQGSLPGDVRRKYHLASCSNGLAGAIRYHLAVLADESRTERAKADSAHALRAWERAVRRAAALLSTRRGH